MFSGAYALCSIPQSSVGRTRRPKAMPTHDIFVFGSSCPKNPMPFVCDTTEWVDIRLQRYISFSEYFSLCPCLLLLLPQIVIVSLPGPTYPGFHALGRSYSRFDRAQVQESDPCTELGVACLRANEHTWLPTFLLLVFVEYQVSRESLLTRKRTTRRQQDREMCKPIG